nr:immunoglobulin heavy chain junction region [Mus musculus]
LLCKTGLLYFLCYGL